MKKTVVILSVGSDIGKHLAKDYLAQGWQVIGTFRDKRHVLDLMKEKNCRLFSCDLSRKASIQQFLTKVKLLNVRWDVFISCTGYLLPAQPFFKSNFDEWSDSVSVNCLEQLRVLHGLYSLRNKKKADVVFFAGGGMNNAVVNLSAYTASKIFLTKMCEFLDLEEKSINIFIVGPGWTKTKIHAQILNDPRAALAKRQDTKISMTEKAGTPLDDISQCIQWLCEQGRTVAGGRNFSVVYDPWQKGNSNKLVAALKADPNMYKLRRCGNGFK